MAGLSFAPEAREQFAAVARLRWQLFINSLRTTRGKLELASHIFIGLLFTVGGLGGAIGFGVGAWYFVSQREAEWLAVLLWPVFLFWQLFPVVASGLTQSVESENLLRFPLSYRNYFLIRLAYGALDPVTAVGSLWLFGIVAGIAFAAPVLLPWAGLVLLVFAVFNIFLAQMVFAWTERWLAQRRTREIMGVLFFLFLMSFQFITPLMSRYGRKASPEVMRFGRELSPVQRSLPPGIGGDAIAQTLQGQFPGAMGSLAMLCAYAIAMGGLLNIRLRAQYRGESLSEAESASAPQKANGGPRRGWNVFGLPGPVAASFEKELRYLSRSGPMLFTLIVPLLMLLFFRLGPGTRKSGGGFAPGTHGLAFPIGALYTLLLMTNLLYNHFGGEGNGIQFLFASPASFRQIVLGKNLAHVAVFLMEIALVWLGVLFLYHLPALAVTVATLAGMLFILPADLAAGNLLSVYSPRKIEYATFGKQRASQMTVLASMGIRLVLFGTGVLVVIVARHYGNLWLAVPVFLWLGALGFGGYFVVLNRMNGMALTNQENLISVLGKA